MQTGPSGGAMGDHHTGPPWGPRERPRKEVTSLGFPGLRITKIILGFAKDSHLYKDFALTYEDFALLWIWI